MTALFKPGAPIRVGTRASALAVAQTSASPRSSAPTSSSRSLGGRPVDGATGFDRWNGRLRLGAARRAPGRRGRPHRALVQRPPDGPGRRHPACGRAGASGCARRARHAGRRHARAAARSRFPRRDRVAAAAAQLLAARPDLEVVGIRGNVDTRLGRLYDPDDDRRVDGLVLAAAGLERLGRLGEASELLPLETWPTAPAQGALALEIREDASAPARPSGSRRSTTP